MNHKDFWGHNFFLSFEFPSCMGCPSALKMCLCQVSNVKAPRERGSWEVTNINDNRMHLGHLKWWLPKTMRERERGQFSESNDSLRGPLIYKGIKRSPEVELWSKGKRGKHLQATIVCFFGVFFRPVSPILPSRDHVCCIT